MKHKVVSELSSYLRRVGRATGWSCSHRVSEYKQRVINTLPYTRKKSRFH